MLRLGTRGSPLALVQANLVRDALLAAHGWAPGAIEIVPIRTTGDKVQDRPLAEIGGKALWTKELDRALLAGEIDFAVHSMKDVETIRPESIAIAAMLPREDVRDRLIGADSIEALPRGARIGTSSPRRAAQMRRIRPDLVIVPLRGNVDTRLAKVRAGEADATLLAAAGLERLGRPEIGTPIALDQLLPAPSQGAVGIEVRTDNVAIVSQIAAIGDRATERCVLAERAFLAALGADCHSPVAALATLDGERLRLRAEILSEDGAEHIRIDRHRLAGTAQEAAALAGELLAAAPPSLRALFGH
ncbi:hydroxymethylbilane synthase [Sphingomonas sp. BT-65]|uniref:hydroxymethylbilane synthase n=1 Tax=Sphingomonas sp. BT-65 TaxID=2989821 RepID=UPI002235D52C|nr:hydroxymethylbilane synthase [Sphingomonas sp. BT-65]MCW4462437.1 hydroxymethylbilane synthase [Sphingomonas sp. BT-65]